MDSQILIYQTKDGLTKINVNVTEDTVWLSQVQISELFQVDKSSISRHINNILEEGELEKKSTVAKFATVQIEGNRKIKRDIEYYNLDMIISVGYRVNSLRGTQFRIWANKVLKEYMLKGFALDDERLKNGGGRNFKELLQRIRDIRSSERNLYQQVTDLYATSIDYDPKAQITKDFFATVQNKLHYAAHQHTAAEVIFDRVDNLQPNVGMTNFKGSYPILEDVKIAKNFLNEKELQVLNLLVSQFFDYAELQALEEKAMTMQDWINELDNQIINNKRPLLQDKGRISHNQAIEKAEKEFNIYRAREMKNLVSDFDKATKKLKNK